MTNVPAEFVDKITQPQRGFLNSLVEERDLSGLTQEQRDWLRNTDWANAPLNISKGKASEIISLLLALPKEARSSLNGQDIPAVPAGRYAIENEDGELRFYKLWVGKTGYMKMYVLHGPDESALHFNTMRSILEKITKAGVHECATRYGREIGSCCICGRRLTNTLSRHLGIGPVCGGRTWQDDEEGNTWKDYVSATRAHLVEHGIDPDSETVDA